MVFEIYKPRGERKEKPSLISISKNSLVMNNKAREKLNNPTNIELAFDRETNIIRIRPSSDGLTVKKTKVFAKGFFNHFGISKKGKFIAEYNENDHALYADIDKPSL